MTLRTYGQLESCFSCNVCRKRQFCTSIPCCMPVSTALHTQKHQKTLQSLESSGQMQEHVASSRLPESFAFESDQDMGACFSKARSIYLWMLCNRNCGGRHQRWLVHWAQLHVAWPRPLFEDWQDLISRQIAIPGASLSLAATLQVFMPGGFRECLACTPFKIASLRFW